MDLELRVKTNTEGVSYTHYKENDVARSALAPCISAPPHAKPHECRVAFASPIDAAAPTSQPRWMNSNSTQAQPGVVRPVALPSRSSLERRQRTPGQSMNTSDRACLTRYESLPRQTVFRTAHRPETKGTKRLRPPRSCTARSSRRTACRVAACRRQAQQQESVVPHASRPRRGKALGRCRRCRPVGRRPGAAYGPRILARARAPPPRLIPRQVRPSTSYSATARPPPLVTLPGCRALR